MIKSLLSWYIIYCGHLTENPTDADVALQLWTNTFKSSSLAKLPFCPQFVYLVPIVEFFNHEWFFQTSSIENNGLKWNLVREKNSLGKAGRLFFWLEFWLYKKSDQQTALEFYKNSDQISTVRAPL